MKAIGLIITITLVFCCSTNAQNSIVSGGFYQTISDSVSGGSSQSQVSSLVVDTPGASWGFDNFDNRTDTQPFYFRGGANPAFTWTYNAGPAVRGHVNFSAGAFINYPFASDNNPTESTELVFTIQPHTIPKLRPAINQFVVNVNFTVTGRLAVFGNVGPGSPPTYTRTVLGQGSGYVIYRRRDQQYNIQGWRGSPQASLILSTISLNFTAPPTP